MTRRLLLLLTLCLIGWSPLLAQKEKFKALFIYKFTQNLEWPPTGSQQQFVIGVVGNSAVFGELQNIAKTQKVVGLPIKVVNYTTPKVTEYCHLVYLSPNKSSSIAEMLGQINGKATLVVSDGKELVQKGSDINFVEDGDKLKFEICKKNIDRRGLKCNTALVNLGIPIN